MAGTIRLGYGGTYVDLSPLITGGYERPKDKHRVVNIALDGTRYAYEWYHKNREVIPINDLPETDYNNIYSWWDNDTEIDWYYDYDTAPGISITAQIVNATNPLRPMPPDWDKYHGTLIIREV